MFQLIPLSSKKFDKLIQEDQFLNNIILKHQSTKFLYIAALNKHKIYQELGGFFEFVRSFVDMENLLHDFDLLCSKESLMKVVWLVHPVIRAYTLFFLYAGCPTTHDSPQIPVPWLSLYLYRVLMWERV